MRNKEVDMIEVGTKIIGNFGAMIPLSFGEVDNLSYKVRASNCIINKETDYMVKVKWDNGDYTWLDASEIDTAVGKLSPKAAALLPIGYYTEEEYYAR